MSNAFSDSIKTLFLLLWDEFKGYAKSKTIIALWIGVPILVIVIHFLTPLQRELPVTRYTGLVLAITGGVLGSLKVPAYIIASRDDPVIPSYDLANLARPETLKIEITPRGGHCGFIENYRLTSWADQRMAQIFNHEEC